MRVASDGSYYYDVNIDNYEIKEKGSMQRGWPDHNSGAVAKNPSKFFFILSDWLEKVNMLEVDLRKNIFNQVAGEHADKNDTGGGFDAYNQEDNGKTLTAYHNINEKGNSYNQMAGENAKTAALEKLDLAKKMAEEGKSESEIYDATGWIKGQDGQWRFEIPDDLKAVDFEGIEERDECSFLTDFRQHEDASWRSNDIKK